MGTQSTKTSPKAEGPVLLGGLGRQALLQRGCLLSTVSLPLLVAWGQARGRARVPGAALCPAPWDRAADGRIVGSLHLKHKSSWTQPC